MTRFWRVRPRRHSSERPHLVVHLGARKTATTFIQRAIGLNEAHFIASGIYLPRSGRFDLNPGNISHHHLAFDLQQSPRFRPDLGGWDDLRSELAAKRPETVFLTCELFEHIITEERGAQALLEQFRSISDNITLVLVARDWPSFVNSMYNQAIKMFAISIGFNRYVRLNVEAGLTRWADLYRPLLDEPTVSFKCVTYEDLRDPDPLTALLRAAELGHAVTHFDLPGGLINTSLGAIGLEVTTILGKYLSADIDDWSWFEPAAETLHIRNLVATDRRGWNAEPFWGWSPPLFDRFHERIRHDMDEFAEAVWGRKWPGAIGSDRPQLVSNFEHYPPDLLADTLEHIAGMRRLYRRLRVA